MQATKKIVHNPAIFNDAPETKEELEKRGKKSQLLFMFFVFCGWFFIKGLVSLVSPSTYSLLTWSSFVDPIGIVFGAWLTFARGKHLLSLYRYNTDEYRQAFDTRYRKLQFSENKEKVRAYMNHPNLADRQVTMAEVTALMALIKQEVEDRKKVDYSTDDEDKGKVSFLSD